MGRERNQTVFFLNVGLLPRTQTSLSLDENVRAKEGGKETTGETSLRLPSLPFPWSLAVHHQSLDSTLRKTKRLRRRLVGLCSYVTEALFDRLKKLNKHFVHMEPLNFSLSLFSQLFLSNRQLGLDFSDH